MPIVARGIDVLRSFARAQSRWSELVRTRQHLLLALGILIGCLGAAATIGAARQLDLLAAAMAAWCAITALRRSGSLSGPARRGWQTVAFGSAVAALAFAWRLGANPTAKSAAEWPVHAGLMACLLA